MNVIRPMLASDVPAAHAIRVRVRENQLSDPSVVTEADYHDFMARDTKSSVGERDGQLAGFAMVDVEKQNLWAIFVAPEYERKGIGKALHHTATAWYWHRSDVLRLSTAPRTRAAAFYHMAGYRTIGRSESGELILELHRPTDPIH
ncbi:MAG: GNAT family N-acetyltransferase [Flavobacteriales bacterium]|nr:GNAT family N-acetyltransferase [Flavobacteriales bacterium]